MKRYIFLLALITISFVSCSKDDDQFVSIAETPKTYNFKRNEKSTVSYTKALTDYNMALALVENLGSEGLENTSKILNNMYADGIGFSDVSLNTSGVKLRELVASASSTLTAQEKDAVKTKIDNVIENFVTEVIPAKNNGASDGKAGNIEVEDDESHKKRYFNKKGIEADQTVSKILFGALFVDQIANNHLSEKNMSGLTADNDANKMLEGKNYTALEQAWDMSYGYVFGLEGENPLKTVKTGYLNSYLKSNYTIKNEFNLFFDNVLTAFKKGRQAVVDKDYAVMNAQAKIVREQISKMMAVRTVHYLWKGLGAKEGKQLHALSEVYGFLYGLQFAHLDGKQLGTAYTQSYITEFDTKGAYNISDEKIDELMSKIAQDFNFSKEDALK